MSRWLQSGADLAPKLYVWEEKMWREQRLCLYRPAQSEQWQVIHWPQNSKIVLSEHADLTTAKVVCTMAAATGKYRV